MSKRNLLNLILLLFILVLVIFVIYKPGKDVAVVPPNLTNIKAENIKHIKINRHQADSAEQNLEFKKTSGGWGMLHPYQLEANTFRINSILKLLSTVSLSQNDLSTLNRDTFGLSKPKATITFNDTTIIFGHNKSLKNHRYIETSSMLHMITDTFYYQLNAKSESYINHKLLPEKSKIIKLHLPELKLENVAGKWKASTKIDSYSADSINQLISEWQLSQAYDINKVTIKPKQKADIDIYLDNNKVIHFKLEKSTDNFRLINIDSGIRYILSADRKNKLLNISSLEQDD